MPEVGYSKEPIHHDLKTVEGGFVELRRLPYDEILKRREMGTRLSIEQSETRGRRRKQALSRDERNKIGIELMQVMTREYEFANCIVNHNLTVDNQPVDFSQPRMAFKIVNPTVLQEIELLLAELNMETDEEELEDFSNVARLSSSTEQTLPEKITETS